MADWTSIQSCVMRKWEYCVIIASEVVSKQVGEWGETNQRDGRASHSIPGHWSVTIGWLVVTVVWQKKVPETSTILSATAQTPVLLSASKRPGPHRQVHNRCSVEDTALNNTALVRHQGKAFSLMERSVPKLAICFAPSCAYCTN